MMASSWEQSLEMLAQERQRALAKLRGSKNRNYWVELGPPLSSVELAGIERRFVPLPEPLRAFLLTEGVGIAPSGYNGLGSLGPSSQRAALERPFPFTESAAQGVVHGLLGHKDRDPLDGTLTMASEGCGTYSFIVVTGPARGSVWTDLMCVDDGLVRVADDFAEYYRTAIAAYVGDR